MSKATPEGAVKEIVKKLIVEEMHCVPASKASLVQEENYIAGWFYMPVQNGMGVVGIPDFIGHYRGLFFAVETKAPKKEPTARQQHQLNAIQRTGGVSFVVSNKEEAYTFFKTIQERVLGCR